jgi:dolichol-phosphate mannosyltransferase
MKSDNLSERRFLFIPLRFFKFAVVGGSGVLVNMGVLFVLTEWIGLYYLISSLVAIELSIISNFILNDFWTWGDRKDFTGSGFFIRMIKYNISAGTAAFTGNYFTLILLTELFGLYYILSNLIGIAVGVIINYSLNDRWTYRILDEYIRK